ncbi:hypothetical protein Rsub_00790 [Raphidocelis subcapitata]|uniref:Uncharacterized protein n=1 Tax=Raphidocelis subcapitata TaxID=307507 RepID=A0A2V0NL28_9CHLO|nr:hypothetical protein Rsub_00790 [Raphidocelis subcapitata]|eukprot:GBF88078.1 hypothetical protein Rsub_00790 [Raphidocelis subcapitata]
MPYIRNGKVVDSPAWWVRLIALIAGLFRAALLLLRTLLDPAAGDSYVQAGQSRRPPDRGPGGGGPSGRGGGGGGSRVVGFGEMKNMGSPPCGGGG